MRKSYLSFFICIFLLVCNIACKKSEVIPKSNESLIDAAKHFFNEEVTNSITNVPATGSSGINENPRKEPSRKPIWENANITHLSTGSAVVVPVNYDRPFLIKSNFAGNKLYSINDITKLLIYKDRCQKYHAEMITLFPDSNYKMSDNKSFRGFILVEDWSGNFLKEYKYSDGAIKKLGTTIVTHNSISQTSVNAESSVTVKSDLAEIVQVCYSIEEYNYSVDDPEGGVYSSESLGCSTYFFQDAVGSGLGNTSGGDYGSVGGGGGSGISPAKPVTVVTGNNIIANIKDYTKCFDNIAGNGYSYKVTLCISQPEPGTRQTWDLNSANGSSATSNPFFVGHTFLVFTQSTPSNTIARNVGFYPKSSVNPYSPSSQGVLNNDEEHNYDISLAVTLTNSQFTSMLNFIDQGNSAGFLYNLNTNNCTTFALNAFGSIGIYLPRTVGSWLNGGGDDPGDLGEDIRNMSLSSNMTRTTIDGSHPNQGTCY